MSQRSDQFQYMALDDFEELLADKPRDERWELIGGRVVRMMVGARWEHHIIIQNLVVGLRQRLRAKGAPCHVFSESFFMKKRALDSATLPDVMVRCGALAAGATSVDDPVVLVEVISLGSEMRDRFEKWRVYRQLPSLQHYVLVERDRPAIEVFDRAGEAWATMRGLEGFDALLELPALDLSISLRDIYQDVLPE
jgi:Uma2 family endonuclease